MATTILISGPGPGQWGDFLRDALIADFPDAAGVALVSASLDGWAVEVTLAENGEVEPFVERLNRYLSSEPDPWDVNVTVTEPRPED